MSYQLLELHRIRSKTADLAAHHYDDALLRNGLIRIVQSFDAAIADIRARVKAQDQPQ